MIFYFKDNPYDIARQFLLENNLSLSHVNTIEKFITNYKTDIVKKNPQKLKKKQKLSKGDTSLHRNVTFFNSYIPFEVGLKFYILINSKEKYLVYPTVKFEPIL